MRMARDSYMDLRAEFVSTFPQAISYGMNLTTLIPTGETQVNTFTRKPYDILVGIQWWENGGLNIVNPGGLIEMLWRNPDGSWGTSDEYDSFRRGIDPNRMMDSYEPMVRYLIHKKTTRELYQ